MKLSDTTTAFVGLWGKKRHVIVSGFARGHATTACGISGPVSRVLAPGEEHPLAWTYCENCIRASRWGE